MTTITKTSQFFRAVRGQDHVLESVYLSDESTGKKNLAAHVARIDVGPDLNADEAMARAEKVANDPGLIGTHPQVIDLRPQAGKDGAQ